MRHTTSTRSSSSCRLTASGSPERSPGRDCQGHNAPGSRQCSTAIQGLQFVSLVTFVLAVARLALVTSTTFAALMVPIHLYTRSITTSLMLLTRSLPVEERSFSKNCPSCLTPPSRNSPSAVRRSCVLNSLLRVLLPATVAGRPYESHAGARKITANVLAVAHGRRLAECRDEAWWHYGQSAHADP